MGWGEESPNQLDCISKQFSNRKDLVRVFTVRRDFRHRSYKVMTSCTLKKNITNESQANDDNFVAMRHPIFKIL